MIIIFFLLNKFLCRLRRCKIKICFNKENNCHCNFKAQNIFDTETLQKKEAILFKVQFRTFGTANEITHSKKNTLSACIKLKQNSDLLVNFNLQACLVLVQY